MLRIFESGPGLSRRELMRVGGLSALGLSLPTLLRARSATPSPAEALSATFGRAKSCIFLWLQGGPPQHETFDPKPDAPAEIRGEFKPIRTNVPGIDFCELLPRTARIADKLAVVRSIATGNDLHDASGYWILTGAKYVGSESRRISPTDWPYLGSVVKRLKPSEKLPAFTTVWLPDVMRLNDNVTPAGQTAGFLGKAWDPERIVCEPADPNFRIEGLSLPDDVPPLRLDARRRLLEQVEGHFRTLERNPASVLYDAQAGQAVELLASGKARAAFDLGKEPRALLERYGAGTWGRSLVLARRLVEAGVRLVHVNWPREKGDNAVDNPLWDTHAQNADRLQDVLCPQFDVGFTALIQDLEDRGLLDQTLVVAIGEFGRTPKINAVGGRDHWGHVFSFAMAGAGIRAGQAHGSSDAQGAYPKTNKVEPQDFTATIFHLLGISHHDFFPDAFGRPIRVTSGEPIGAILGLEPATRERRDPTGDLAFVPAYDPALLLNTSFADGTPLQPIVPGRRTKGWQASPIAADGGFGVRLVGDGQRHVRIGFDGPGGAAAAAGTKAILAQEVRGPRAGRYTLTIDARSCGDEAAWAALRDRCAFRGVIFGYDELSKDPRKVREFGSVELEPFSDGARPTQFRVSATLKSQDDGAMQLSRGVGVAITAEIRAGGPFAAPGDAWLRIDRVTLAFDARPRNDEVTV